MLRRLFSIILGAGNALVADRPVAMLVGGQTTTRIWARQTPSTRHGPK
jgi:hypothetical protein